jgi:hypothetical protein
MTIIKFLTGLFQQTAGSRKQPRAIAAVTILVCLGQAHFLRAQSQARGDSIRGEAITSTNSAIPARVETNINFAARMHTNATGEYVIGLDTLSSYPLELPDNLVSNTNQAAWADAQVNGMIPASIKAFDGKRVRVEGYMLPTVLDKKGKVTDFLLVASQISCCYGGPTQVHEFITVHVKGTSVRPNMDATIPVGGVLHVGAIRENGQLVGIYRMEAEKLVVPKPD